MKYRQIGGVAHNFGHSFLSDTNAVDDAGRYVIVPRVLFANAALERAPRVRIDFTTGAVEPPSLRTPEVERAIANYARWLPELMESHGLDPAAVVGAELTLTFDYDNVRRTRDGSEQIQEFACTVALTDDRGRIHHARPDHWWVG